MITGGPSGYEIDQLDRLDYVELGFKPNSRDRTTWRSAGICGACCPMYCPSELELVIRYQPSPSRSMRTAGIDQARRRAIARSPNVSRTGIHNAATALIEARNSTTPANPPAT